MTLVYLMGLVISMTNTWDEKTIREFIDRLLLDPRTNAVLNVEEMAQTFRLKPKSVYAKVIDLRNANLLPALDMKNDEVNKRYSANEDKIIKNMVLNDATSKEIARVLDRSEESVARRRWLLKIKVVYLWTEEEIDFIIRNIQLDSNGITQNTEYLSNKLRNHTRRAVQHKIFLLRKEGKIPPNINRGTTRNNFYTNFKYGRNYAGD